MELAADSGARDTVIPKGLCPGIPAMPSLQSIRGLEYEVANGESSQKSGERRCLLWMEGASAALGISMRVVDVHKAWLFACSRSGFKCFGPLCPHGFGAHTSLRG